MRSSSRVMTAAACALVAAAVYGCNKQDSGGPGERAGKQVDRAMDKAGKQVEKAGEAIQDTARGKK